MDWSQIYQDTFIPELPKYWNANFDAFKRYMDVFYDETRGILIKPLNTTGRVKAANGEFVTTVTDNLIVKNQFTNLYGNITTADESYYNMLDASAIVPRDPCTYGIDTSVWTFPYEDPNYKVISVNKPYYKLSNEYPVQLYNLNLSQVVGFYLDPSLIGPNDYEILLDPCLGTTYTADPSSAGTYIELIADEFDASWGSTWTAYKPAPGGSSSGGGGGTIGGSGTINYLPIFTSTSNIGNSLLHMSGGILQGDVDISVGDVIIHNAVRDSSGNVIIGYGSPLQINDPAANRDVSIYGDTRIDGSLYVNGTQLGIYDPSLPDDLKTPDPVGGIPADTSVAYLRGKTYEEIINDLLFPTVLAFIAASNSATLSGFSTSTVEVGFPYTVEATGIYNPGDIDNGDNTNGPNLTGDANSYTFFLPNGSVDGTYSASSNTQAHTYSSYNVGFGTNRWEVSIGYDAGSGAYYDNKGVAGTNLDAQRVAGEATDYSNVITGRRYAWRGTGAPIPTNSAQVRALVDKVFLSSTNTGTFDITIPSSTPEVYFFIPIGKSVTVQYVESSFADVTGSFTTGPISVNDAGGAAQSYESWTTTIGGGGYPGTATYRVTIT